MILWLSAGTQRAMFIGMRSITRRHFLPPEMKKAGQAGCNRSSLADQSFLLASPVALVRSLLHRIFGFAESLLSVTFDFLAGPFTLDAIRANSFANVRFCFPIASFVDPLTLSALKPIILFSTD